MFLLLACLGGKDDPATGDSSRVDTGPPEPGQLALRFELDADLLEDMQDEPAGDFFGSVWDGDDVDNLGPAEGAESFFGCDTPGLDLSDGPTDVLFTTEELPGDHEVVILGFVDTDDNAVVGDEDPDDDDPVTLPHQNRFTVVPGETTEVTVYFGLLNP